MGVQTVNEFVQEQIRIWGYDYIENLFDSGYEPTYIVSAGEIGKWVWLQPAYSIANHN